MSAGLSGSAALLSGVSRYEAGEERSRLYSANADIATRQMQSEAAAGAYNEEAVRMRGAALEGHQVAQIGASNLQQGGTMAQVVEGSRLINERDALMVRNNALRRAWGFEVQGVSDRLQAGYAQRGAVGAGVESILAGGAKAYDEYAKTGTFF